MSKNDLERAVELGKKLEHFFMALNGSRGFPYISSVRGIEQIDENQLAIEEWICPATVSDLSDHPEIAILIWDPATDAGYEVLGMVLAIESRDHLNGYSPETERKGYLPQVRRRLSVRVEKTVVFSHALQCSDIDQTTHPKAGGQSEEDSFVPYCGFAPEWAEHARFNREDPPCDDGRAGESRACLMGVEDCVLGTQ